MDVDITCLRCGSKMNIAACTIEENADSRMATVSEEDWIRLCQSTKK